MKTYKISIFVFLTLFISISTLCAFGTPSLTELTMENNLQPPSNNWFDRVFNQNPNIRKIEKTLRDYNLIWRRDIQSLLRTAYHGTSEMKNTALRGLQLAIDAYEIQLIRNPDPFKPYGPRELLTNGQLHLLTQMDGVEWKLPVDSLLTGSLVLGPQDAGKSRFVMRICTEIKRIDPSIKFTIIDPKNGFLEYAGMLNAIPIDLNNYSFSINKVAGIPYRKMVLELMPQLGDTIGIIFGNELLNESSIIAVDKLNEYEKATGQNAELSFRDIDYFLPFAQGARSGRRLGYREAAQTSLRRAMSENDLFACRKGVDLKWLFENDTILDARSLVDDVQCRTLSLLLFYTRYQQCRYLPQTSRLRHLIIIDDSSRFVGNPPHQQNADSVTPAYAHILATLRSTGTGVCCVTQLPAHMNNAFLALSRTMFAVGPMAGGQHLKVISDFMQLNADQIKAVTRLSKREAIGFSPNTNYNGIVHGWVPHVADPPTNILIPSAPNLGIIPWQPLNEIPATQSVPEKQSQTNSTVVENTNKETLPPTPAPELSQFGEFTKKLLWDCVTYLFNIVSTRIERLNMTGRNFEIAKKEAVDAGMLIESDGGRAMFLIPTVKLFETFDILPPYLRNVSIEHSYYSLLFNHILKSQPSIRKTQIEYPIDQSGSTSDIWTISQSGEISFYEVTLNVSNILANAIKYKDSSCSKIVFLCRTNQLAKAVEKYFKNRSLDPQLAAKIKVIHFSKMLKDNEKIITL
ncbi:MAG: hypothetical protein ABFD79_06245 [Phycisphaerales bacterium]